jgi:hypothetical protein
VATAVPANPPDCPDVLVHGAGVLSQRRGLLLRAVSCAAADAVMGSAFEFEAADQWFGA